MPYLCDWETGGILSENPRVRKIFCPAGNGCANFMGAWKMRFFRRKTHVHKILVLGGGYFGFWGGGVPILFLWARGFSDTVSRDSLSSAPNSVSSAKNSVSSLGTHT